MSATEITTRTVEPLRVARVSGEAENADPATIGPLTQQLFGALMGPIQQQQIAMTGPVVATYQPNDGGGLTVSACCPVGPDTMTIAGLEVADLPGLDEVATLRHDGLMAELGRTYQALERWIEEQGARTDGSAREVYLVSHPEPEARWQTEVQLPLVRGA